jgi:hypothetical protein
LLKRKPIPTAGRLYSSTLISLFTDVLKQQIRKERKKEYEINERRKIKKE